MLSPPFKIGELAAHTGSQVETIRYYEREGLLPVPMRSESNYRLYSEKHLETLHFILHCRSLDMSLDEIRSLLALRDAPEQSCKSVNELLDRHIEHVAVRIKQLEGLKEHLISLRSQCHSTQAAKNCEILHSLANAESSIPANLGSHDGRGH